MSHPFSQDLNNNSGTSISLWMEDIQIPSPPPLNQDMDTEVCIIGSGIAGLTCAYLLLQAGKKVIILEAGPIAGGQSARTTGHLAWALDDHFSELEKLFKTDGAKLAAESHQAAVNQIEAIIRQEGINCDFQRLDGYLFVPPGDSLDILNEEFDVLQRIGCPIFRMDRAPFSSFDTGPCLRFPNQGQFHILKYLAGLITAIYKKGGQIFAHTRVSECKDGSPCRVITEKGDKITAQDIIVATDTPINDRFFIHSKQSPYRTYVIAASIPKGSVPRLLAWDTPDPYHYIRTQDHPSDKQLDWLIIGGEDHKTGQDANIQEKYDNLEKWARERFTMMQTVEFQWSGQIMEPIDSLAFIGKNPHDAHVYVVTGDSGNGLTHATIAGLLLRDLILGHDNPWAKLYDPSRKTLSFTALNEFVKENVNVATQYSDWLTPGEVSSSNDIQPGTGAIVRDGAVKLAVYRDDEGELHCYSAICPHLGCIVKWNPGEKSWDCPCHGSRFDCEGHILNGPATKDLTSEPPHKDE